MKKNKVLNLFGDKKIVQNTGVKYSTLIEQFMQPFENSFNDMTHFEYQEDIFDFVINAWNLGNMQSLIKTSEFDPIISTAKNKDINYPLLKKMIASKVSNFKEFTNFIIDFEFYEKKGIPTLKVFTQSENGYITNMLKEESNKESSPDDFEENYINRAAVSLKPLQPFIDWVNSLYPNNPIDEATLNQVNIYLINDDILDIEAHLKKKFDRYFMIELGEWQANKKEWPQRRNHKMFKKWFRIDISKAIYDLEKKPISKMD
jgi:hypothetical protein